MNYKFKPNKEDFPVFYKGYIDTLDDAPLIETLTNEKQYAMDAFEKIPSDKADFRYAEGKWTIKQVLIHIIDTEMIFGYRGLAISRGETQSLPGFDQDEYMAETTDTNTNLEDLIKCFENLRATNIALFSRLREKDLERKGTASGYSVSAKTIGYFIAGHAKYHVNILKERYGI